MNIDLEKYAAEIPCAKHPCGLTFATPTPHVMWRVNTLMTKEPDTIEWLDDMDESDVLWDIGANIGLYSIYAAKLKGVTVAAFEPESQNYALLNYNIHLNVVGDLVTAFPISISNVLGIDKLNLSAFMPGGSCHSYGEEVDFRLEPRVPAHRQGSISVRGDMLVDVFGFQQPTHIKVDVDGIEHLVYDGMVSTLNAGVESILLELNTNLEEHNRVWDQFTADGWKVSVHKDAIRTEGPFKGVGNHIFRRKG